MLSSGMMKRGALSLSLLLFLVVALCSAAAAQGSNPIGKPAPDFTLSDMQGEKITLSQLKERVVILNFWATTCPPCREEKPLMDTLYRENRDKGLVILAVTGENKETVTKFLRDHPVSFTVLQDDKGDVHRTYGVFNYPDTFVIARDGTLVKRLHGPQEWTSGPMHQLIQALLAD